MQQNQRHSVYKNLEKIQETWVPIVAEAADAASTTGYEEQATDVWQANLFLTQTLTPQPQILVIFQNCSLHTQFWLK